MNDDRPDPLAPPPRRTGQGAGRSGAQEEPEGDFSMCCTGCGSESAWILTLGCTAGEHVGKFGYCNTHRMGPFWCGRCRITEYSAPLTAMKVLKIERITRESDAYMQEEIAKIFDGKAP